MSDTTPSPLFGANADPGSQIDRNIITEPVVIGLIGLRQELADFEESTAAETMENMANIDDQFLNETTGVARLPVLEPEGNINDIDPNERLSLPTPREIYPPEGGNKKRERRSFAKKKMLGAASLYSKDGLPIPGLNGSLVGYIRECPRKSKNGGKYIVDWVTFSSTGLTGFPSNVVKTKLKTEYDSNDAIGFYETTGDRINETLRRTFGEENIQPPVAAVVPVGQVSTPPAPPQALRTPTPLRYVARAAIMTAASASSLSTLTRTVNTRNSTNSRSQQPESDSDDGSDVDEFDDFWKTMPDLVDRDDDYQSDSDDEHEPATTPGLQPATTPDPQADEEITPAQLIETGLIYDFKKLEPTDKVKETTPPLYNGPTGLRPEVAESFENPMEAFEEVGGFTKKFVAKLTFETNEYYRLFIKPDCRRENFYNGRQWVNVHIHEMYVFFGIMLRISMNERDSAGYFAYFAENDQEIHTGYGSDRQSKTLPGTKGWAREYMSLERFKQIRGAFHPMNKAAGDGGDKAYQLRSAINHLNHASKKAFTPSGHLAFDEGGVSCRSRRCPVRQYNKEKPAKFRVDFFILADSSNYAILHIDVYQGKNKAEVNIDEEAKGLPTTMKAVYNAVMKTGINDDTFHGVRIIAMDNRYACPELAVLLRDRCKIYMTGTCKANRKGWPKEIMVMSKKGERGEAIVAYDHVQELIAIQWRDNCVVKCLSSIMDNSVEMTQRRLGSELLQVPVPHPLKVYQSYMGGVDKGDQIRVHLGSFARKAHFKKWYKKAFMAIIDCMLLNAFVGWNESAKGIKERNRMSRHDFFAWVADDLLQHAKLVPKPKSGLVGRAATAARRARVEEESNIVPQCMVEQTGSKLTDCCVCKLDYNQNKEWKGVRSNVCFCRTCNKNVHMHMVEPPRLIHSLWPKTFSCHDILKSPEGRKIWPQTDSGRQTVRTAHPLVAQLKLLHKLQPTKRKATDRETRQSGASSKQSPGDDDASNMGAV